ncbi:MAG: N-6 DNA methylase [Snowella sp.]|nr:N-6 DNA methylase [Snowella sp.]
MNLSSQSALILLKGLCLNLLSFLDLQGVDKKKAFLLLWRLLLIRHWAVLERPHQLTTARDIASSQEIWKQWEGCTENVGAAIAKSMYALERANNVNAGYLANASFFRWQDFPDEVLRRVIFEMSFNCREEIKILSFEDIGNLLDRLIEEQWLKHPDLRKYWYPSSIVSLMVMLLEAQGDWVIYDPICGVGQLLKAVYSFNQSRIGERDLFRADGDEWSVEIEALGCLYMALQGFSHVRLKRDASFSLPEWAGGELVGRADGIVSVFPLLQEDWKRMLPLLNPGHYVFGSPKDTEREFAYLNSFTQILKSVKRAVVVMPPGFLFREWDLKIRRDWVNGDLLTAVITLPPNLFHHTPMPTVLLVLETQKPVSRRQEVLFVDGSKAFLKSDSSLDYERLFAVYQAFETVPAVAERTTIQRIQQEDFNLTVSRYLTVVSTPYDWEQAWNQELQFFHECEEQRQQALSAIDDCLLRLNIEEF